VPGCDVVLWGIWFPAFRESVVVSSSRVINCVGRLKEYHIHTDVKTLKPCKYLSYL
jgi:hypothetical protein